LSQNETIKPKIIANDLILIRLLLTQKHHLMHSNLTGWTRLKVFLPRYNAI